MIGTDHPHDEHVPAEAVIKLPFEGAEYSIRSIAALCRAAPGMLLKVFCEGNDDPHARALAFQCDMMLLEHRGAKESTVANPNILVARTEHLFVTVESTSVVWFFGAASLALEK